MTFPSTMLLLALLSELLLLLQHCSFSDAQRLRPRRLYLPQAPKSGKAPFLPYPSFWQNRNKFKQLIHPPSPDEQMTHSPSSSGSNLVPIEKNLLFQEFNSQPIGSNRLPSIYYYNQNHIVNKQVTTTTTTTTTSTTTTPPFRRKSFRYRQLHLNHQTLKRRNPNLIHSDKPIDELNVPFYLWHLTKNANNNPHNKVERSHDGFGYPQRQNPPPNVAVYDNSGPFYQHHQAKYQGEVAEPAMEPRTLAATTPITLNIARTFQQTNFELVCQEKSYSLSLADSYRYACCGNRAILWQTERCVVRHPHSHRRRNS